MAAQQPLSWKCGSPILNYSTKTATGHHKLLLHPPFGSKSGAHQRRSPCRPVRSLDTSHQPGKRPCEGARLKSGLKGQQQCCAGVARSSCCDARSLVAAGQKSNFSAHYYLVCYKSTNHVEAAKPQRAPKDPSFSLPQRNKRISVQNDHILISTNLSSKEKL